MQSEVVPDATVVVQGDGAISTGSGPAIVVKDKGQVIVGLTEERFAEMLDAREAKYLAQLQTSSSEEAALLRSQIAEIERQRNNLQVAFKARIEELRRLRLELKALAVNVPEERLAAAQQALYEGDTKLADQLFAEIEESEAEAIQRAAEAAFQRGKIAEDEVLWADAAEHYARAATLAPDYSKLLKAGFFAWRAGDYSGALQFEKQAVEASAEQFGKTSSQHATAINNYAGTLQTMGRYDEAEPLYRQAIEIGKATIGDVHPDYATRINNLAILLEAMGRYEEAEPLYRQAIEIGKATIGEAHPNYAQRLNNLAVFLEGRRRFEEVPNLYRDAVRISRASLGNDHPDVRAQYAQNFARYLRKHDAKSADLADLIAVFGDDIGR